MRAIKMKSLFYQTYISYFKECHEPNDLKNYFNSLFFLKKLKNKNVNLRNCALILKNFL
jgi:hypothetical protein